MRLVLSLFITLLVVPVANAQSAQETELVMALSRGMNRQSVEYDREVCGYIVLNPQGQMEVSKLSWGGNASCGNMPVPAGYTIISSWHTHAAWAEGYDGEVPSSVDVEGDMRMGVNGWVATPGGRLWYIDGRNGDMHQVCGRDCLPSDPGFFPEEHGPVEKQYTLAELRARFSRR